MKKCLSFCTFHFLVFTSHFLLFTFNLHAQPKYEFRGVWVATVKNIDWPSSKYLSSDSQKTEFIHLLDMHQQNGMNAIIAQIRPSTDAFYPSQYEPWSEYLTGTQGNPPVPYYDPVQFMITETHRRGMEFHAWINPYRADFNIQTSSISPTHITRLHPEWFLIYGDKKYFDPGNKEVQAYVNNIVRDVVSRYSVDAIHFDDYFYPYKITGKEFSDSASFLKYGKGMVKNDWRRSNIDSIIFLLSKTIKEENRYCKFGISPFGVWRNKNKDIDGSFTKNGQSNYDDLYADILLWLKMKWVDYIAPQLYWEIAHKSSAFEILTSWWAKHSYGRALYVGHGIYRANERGYSGWKNPNQIPDQIMNLREHQQIGGSIFFSSNTFAKNPNGWNDSLKNNFYKYPAIIPAMKWIDSVKPAAPVLSPIKILNANNDSAGITLQFSVKNLSKAAKLYALYISSEQSGLNQTIYKLLPAAQDLTFHIDRELITGKDTFFLTITAINKTNNESAPDVIYNLKKISGGWLIN